ncbi:putative serine incorporator/TMS membrane protein [Helianthus annuus]|uniref:Serine incorporator/TMS membrane protein n=1 Tax=Helianthus annuus TaxID=4232 RepID=A0A9K3DI24_HELAN|nr:putative serine incorporator/TMS membrane protein [Helianthus annuus]KAJ0429356.1 putative serine incorporator/TMS membrane protein [Helianthus annuus]KAJ0585561.1 putative serine incorporator/TMS membrane protein [Helianthus annuus]KAJ0636531.1 putative serine incorporator/TMS membrane protein [Helianthus annuus]KAJ0807792.1 putative serine incorporator/TMS membrane protein [Helianthus annuus]
MYTNSWHAYKCCIRFIFCSTFWFFNIPPSYSRTGERLPFLESEELESGKGKKEVEAKHVSYSYTFFHMIFAIASMYSDMLLLGWSSSECLDLIDTGWLVID